MAQTHSKNKRSIARKAPKQIVPKRDYSETSPFPEYIERKDGLYRCLLCKYHTLERYMWLGRCGMGQHQKRGTRHKQLVREWKAAHSEPKSVIRGKLGSKPSNLDVIGTSGATEEQAEFEDSAYTQDLEPSPVPTMEESRPPALYYPTISWDEPLQQGVRVSFDDLDDVSHKSESPVPQTPLSETDKESFKHDDKPSQTSVPVCKYGPIKIDGYYTCIWCQLPYIPQRKYRRCKRAVVTQWKKSPELVRENSPIPDHTSLEYPHIDGPELEPFKLRYIFKSP